VLISVFLAIIKTALHPCTNYCIQFCQDYFKKEISTIYKDKGKKAGKISGKGKVRLIGIFKLGAEGKNGRLSDLFGALNIKSTRHLCFLLVE